MTAIVLALRSGIPENDIMAMVAAAAAALESAAEQGTAKPSAKALPLPRALAKSASGGRTAAPPQLEVAQEVRSESQLSHVLHQLDSAGCSFLLRPVSHLVRSRLLCANYECRTVQHAPFTSGCDPAGSLETSIEQ